MTHSISLSKNKYQLIALAFLLGASFLSIVEGLDQDVHCHAELQSMIETIAWVSREEGHHESNLGYGNVLLKEGANPGAS